MPRTPTYSNADYSKHSWIHPYRQLLIAFIVHLEIIMTKRSVNYSVAIYFIYKIAANNSHHILILLSFYFKPLTNGRVTSNTTLPWCSVMVIQACKTDEIKFSLFSGPARINSIFISSWSLLVFNGTDENGCPGINWLSIGAWV